jgi:hypothetical protein
VEVKDEMQAFYKQVADVDTASPEFHEIVRVSMDSVVQTFIGGRSLQEDAFGSQAPHTEDG